METHNTNNGHNTAKSEIALFFQRWEEEVEAMKLGLQGLALTARHDFIIQRMQSFGDEKMIEMMTLEAKKMNEINKEHKNILPHENVIRGENDSL